MTEHGPKLPDNVKDQVRGDISAVNEAIVSEDSDKISEALERLKNSSMEIGKAIYSQGDSSENQEESSEQPQEEEKSEEEKTEEEKKAEEEKKKNE